MERTDDLMVNNLKLIQDDGLFCFGHDAVELANFAEGTADDHAADLCSGNGIIAVLLAGKKGIKTTAVEINGALAALAAKNAEINGLNDLMNVINLPVQKLNTVLEKGSFSMVTCNPPYFKKGSGKEPREELKGARHEVFITLKEVIACAEYLLQNKGRLYMVYPVSRLAELICLCAGAWLEPKELVILLPKVGAEEQNGSGKKGKPRLCLIKCVKGASAGLDLKCREIKDY